jgi:hypothetical protein
MKVSSKNIILTGALALGIVGMASIGTAMAEDKPEADLTVGVYSQYIWRGFELSKDSIVIQPSMTVAYKGFGFNLWGNLDTDLDPALGGPGNKWNETDMTLSYDGSYKMMSYGVGYIYYALDSLKDSQEIYGTIALDTILAPAFSIYWEIAGLSTTYYTLGISHSFPLSEKMSLDLGAQGSYLDDDKNNYGALHDGILSLALPYSVNDYLSVAAELNWSFALSSDAETLLQAASVSGTDDSFIYGGLSASFAF